MHRDQDLFDFPDEPSALFRDRRDAGRQLAALLERYRKEDPVVLALPRGGVPVAYEVACALDATLDVFVVRKLGAPQQPELGIGAVAPGGVIVIDDDTIRALHISQEQIERVVALEAAELQRRIKRFRGERPEPKLEGRTVILVDDGLATGVTAYAAIHALRRSDPRAIVLAVPVCAAQTAAGLRHRVTELVAVSSRPDFGAVGLWYAEFDQTTDDEVIDLLNKAASRERKAL